MSTPIDEMPGMEIHANVAATLLSDIGAPVNVPLPTTAAIALLFCVVLVAPLGRWPLWTSFAITTIEIAVVWLLGAAIFIGGHRILPASVPIFALVLTLNAVALYEYWRVRRTLARFIGTEMVSQTLHTFVQLRLGGRSERACAFFCDLRGYSALSERMAPTDLGILMNEYTDLLVRVIRRHGGRPIDYQGDGVFILFETEFAGANYPLKAVRAALEMQREFNLLRLTWMQRGAPLIEIGIGIDIGEMMIGAVGSTEHMKLGAIGDAVNVAARVQRLNSECGYNVLITQRTYERVRESVDAVACGVYHVRGRRAVVQVYGIGDAAVPGINWLANDDELSPVTEPFESEEGADIIDSPLEQEAHQV